MHIIPQREHIIPPMVMIPPTQIILSVSGYAATAPNRVQPFQSVPKQQASSQNVIIIVIVRIYHGYDDNDHDEDFDEYGYALYDEYDYDD